MFGKNISTGIELYFHQSISTSQILEDLYLEYGDYLLDDFDKIIPNFFDDDELLKAVFIAPDGVIAAAYPKELSISIGSNILNHPFQKEKAQVAKESRQLSIEGPVSLTEGGVGLVLRNPFYVDEVFKGFVVITVDWYKFSKKVIDFFNVKNSEYDFAVWKSDINEIVVNNTGCLFSNTERKVSDLVSIELDIPSEHWFLSIEPKGGWEENRDYILPFLVFTLFLTLLVLFFLYKQFDALDKAFKMEHDPLTGLYTRSAFYRYAKKWINENQDIEFDMLLVDIEAFKVANSIHGTQKCDEYLLYLVEVLKEENPISIIGRYGGDQFIYVFPASEGKGKIYLESRVYAIMEDAPIKNVQIKFGYVGNLDRSLPMNVLCDRALMAARSILHNFDVVVASYDGEFSRNQLNKQMIESSFEEALKKGNFQVWYQPKFDAMTEKFIGAEALVRWIKEDGSIVSPSDFIYIYEEDGLIVNLDEYVFRTVCETIKTWLSKGVKVHPISVNLSRTSLHHKGIVKKYKSIVERIGIPIEYVPLEITESLAFGNEQIKNLARELKKEGFRIDMDDFGTGSSSLASLNMLPFDVVKLDKSLIDYIGTPDGEELLRHSIELAHFKNIKVIAEGVETEKQLKVLRKLGCDAIQGFYYKPPMSYQEGVEYLSSLYFQGKA
ncbi:MAG: bifunctional diguanylate cyclase/phosphodiesterase [Treponema sp.]|nr:bifunctional diguanylate cyclase/phosphodiesterase [Treponema sp.]